MLSLELAEMRKKLVLKYSQIILKYKKVYIYLTSAILGENLQINWIYTYSPSIKSFPDLILKATLEDPEIGIRLILGPLIIAPFFYLLFFLMNKYYKESFNIKNDSQFSKKIIIIFSLLHISNLIHFFPNKGGTILFLTICIFVISLINIKNKAQEEYKAFFSSHTLFLKALFLSIFSWSILNIIIAEFTNEKFSIIFSPYYVMNIFINSFFIITLFLVFRRLRLSWYINFFLLTFLVVINRLKLEYYNHSIVPSDIFLYKQFIPFLNVIGKDILNYIIIIIFCILLFTTFIVINILTTKAEKLKYKHFFLFLFFFLILTSFLIIPREKLELVENKFKLSRSRFNTSIESKGKGLLYFILDRTHKLIHNSKPKDYSKEKIFSIYNKWTNKYTYVTKDNKEKTNIIIYLGESFWDPFDLQKISVHPDPIPFFHYLEKNFISGKLIVPVYAGNTAQTEFEVLTSLSTRLLSGIAHTTHIIKSLPALPALLKKLNYSTLAVHNFNTFFWNREYVLPRLGIDKFISEKYFNNPKISGNYINDIYLADEIIKRNQNKYPSFTYAIGMVTHGPYSTDYIPRSYTIKGEYQKDKLQEIKANLNVLHEVDLALKKLVTYYKSRKEKTLILFFGDHYPALASSIAELANALSIENIIKRQTLPIIIWANYPLPKTKIETSTNYLAPLILDLTQQPKSPYFKIISEMKKVVPIFSPYLVKTAKSDYLTQLPNQPFYQEWLNDYKLLQYDLLYGKQYIGKINVK